MFDVGFSELVVIGLVALLVLGPKRLPEVARTAGRWMGQFRRLVDGVRQDFHSEINTAEFNELRKIRDDLNEARGVFEKSLAPPDRSPGAPAVANELPAKDSVAAPPAATMTSAGSTASAAQAVESALNHDRKRP